jgi:hypothetical protein
MKTAIRLLLSVNDISKDSRNPAAGKREMRESERESRKNVPCNTLRKSQCSFAFSVMMCERVTFNSKQLFISGINVFLRF